jgi:putative hydrolase of the HAD superfamily
MPGSRAAIDALHRRGLPMGIVSNAQFYTPVLFDAHFALTHRDLGIHDALCSWSFKVRTAKPSVRIFEPVVAALRRRHGILPEQTVYVGNDMLNDVYAAHRAGMRTVLFAGDARSLRTRADRRECAHLEPDAIVTSWDQVPSLL